MLMQNSSIEIFLVNATSSNLAPSEILMPNAQATFSNLQIPLSGQVNYLINF